MTFDWKEKPDEGWLAELRAKYPTERLVDETLTRKMRHRNEPSVPPPGRDELALGLRRALSEHYGRQVEVSGLSMLTGGSSKQQYVLTIADENGVPVRLVARLQNSAAIVETHPQREFDILQAIGGVVPVPTPVLVDPTGDSVGLPCLIYEHRSGSAYPPAEGRVTGPFIGFDARLRAALEPQFLQHLASIATFDVAGARLPSFDVPPAGSNEGVVATIHWWQRVWEEDSLGACPELEAIGHWLLRHAPVIDTVSVVHGDYRSGNFLFDHVTGRITAILDWELAHVGDRHEDLAYILSPLFAEYDEEGRQYAAGLVLPQRLLTEYERLTGLPVDQDRLTYYRMLVAWRAAVWMLASSARCARAGRTANDVLLAWSAHYGLPLLSQAVALYSQLA